MCSNWQISTDGKTLIRNGANEATFVKEIAGKGYYMGTKQLDQIVDLELYIHIARVNRKPYLTVQRGKHRSPVIIEDEKMFFMLPFPHKAPIPENLNDDNASFGNFLEEQNDTGFDY